MPRVHLLILGALLGLLARSTEACGQERPAPLKIDTIELAFSKITINDGLSQGMVGTMAQDHHGFMWFGTKDGLNRHDGYTFRVFRHDAADTNTVRESTISGLHCDRHGRLWVGTATGLDLFDERTERFVHIPIHHPKGDWGGVVHIVLDDNGDLWVSSNQALVKLTFSEPFTGYELPRFTTTWYGDGYTTISRTRDGRLWGNMNELTFRITPKHAAPDVVDTIGMIDFGNARDQFGALTVVEDTTRNRLLGIYENGIVEVEPVSGKITYLIRDRERLGWLQALNPVIDGKGLLWFTTFRGLYRFDPDRRQLIYIESADPDLRPMISTLKWSTIDRTGTLWLGTTGYGLLKYDARKERFNNWPSTSVRALAPTNDGQLLTSHYNSYLTVFDPVKRHHTTVIRQVGDRWPSIAAQLPTQYADMSVQTADGAYWSYFMYGVVGRYDPATGQLDLIQPRIEDEVDDGFIFPLHIGKDGALWTGGNLAFWRIDPTTKVCTPHRWPVPVINNPYPFTTAVHHGSDGVLWIGTVKGLLRFDPKTNTWKTYGHDPKDSTSLSIETVFSICPDPADPLNVLWIGTNGGGLNRFDVRTEKFKRFTTRQGLPNDVVYGVLSDDQGNLWMSTNKGLARLDPRTNTFRNFNAGSGLQSDEFNRHAYCKDKRGWLYFGGVSGFNYFDPRALEQDSTPVDVRITDIRLLNKPVTFGTPGSPLELPVHLSSGMEIPYDANMVTFTFATMEFASPELHEYRYMLEGFDAEWIDAGTTNNAVYTNLDPGTYTFRVRGRNRDGIWAQKGTSFTLSVLPPWWRTWWFYALCGIVVIGGTLLYIRSLRVQKVVLEHTVANRTRELKHEKDRSEELLKNILPENVANELKVRGAAEARHFDQVTVLFSDFREFTRITEQFSPAELVEELNVCFNAFDRIMEKYGVEKIKTIGDAYMAAGGVPDPSGGSPLAVVLAGLEMQQIIKERQAERKAQGKTAFEMRVGIHTGPVVAGIVGRRKFQYDIWGDTVNTASRLETAGETGEVNISSATYALVKDAPELQFSARGQVSAKGKGELEMYYVRARSIQAIVDAEPVKREPETAMTPAELIAEDAAPAEETDASPALSHLSILLAEDNEFNAMVAQGHLENWLPHTKLTHVLNGALAVEALRSNAFDLVLMDIQMPELNGYDAAKAIRALPGDRSRTPIIAMSANVMKAEIDRCMEAGMNAFVPKPYKKEQLLDAIAMVMTNRTPEV
ncbi:MAG TPA: adenylate/guanylate cyclase domain-containing protein [Flavobacteriales bacterium]|nr:adenylate/guanylate cyclase domain-containing protein [Flavobacteriales bacterium]